MFFLNKNILNLQAFETWPYRKTLRIPWTANCVKKRKKKEIVNPIKMAMKQKYFGHTVRDNKSSLLQ